MNEQRKQEVTKKTELKLLRDNINLIEKQINYTNDLEIIPQEEILNKILQKENQLISLLDELKNNKQQFDVLINSQNSDQK